MTAPQLLRVGDLLVAGGPLTINDLGTGAVVELVETTGEQVTVHTNRGKFVFDGDADVTHKSRPERAEADAPFVPMTVTPDGLQVGDMVVAGGGVDSSDTGWGDSSVVQEASPNGDRTWVVRTETAEFTVPAESLLTIYHDVPDGTVVVDELDEHQRAVWAGIPDAVQERMTAPEMAGMGYDDEPVPAYRAAFFTNRRGVKVWHDPTTGRFAPTGYVSLRLLRRLWAGDTKAGMEFDDAVRKLRDREPDISYDAAVARLLGGARDQTMDRLYVDAAQRRMRRLWPATKPLDKPTPGGTMRRVDRSGMALAQRPYRNAPAPQAASVDYLMASRQPAVDGYLLGVGDDRLRLLSVGQGLDGVQSGFAVDDNTGQFVRWEAERGDLSGVVTVQAGSGAVNVGDEVFYMGDSASPVDTPWRVDTISPAGTVLLRDESGVRPDTFVAIDRVTPATITFDGPVQVGRVDPTLLTAPARDRESIDFDPTRDSPLVADLVGMSPGAAVQIGDGVYLKEATGDGLVAGGFVNVTDLSERLSVREAVDVIQSSPQAPLETVVDDNDVLDAIAEQLAARPLSPNEARARRVLDRVSEDTPVVTADEFDALRIDKANQLDAVQSGQSVDALQVPEAVTNLIDRIRKFTDPANRPYWALPMQPGELENEPGTMPPWEGEAFRQLALERAGSDQQIDTLNIRESITDLIDRIRAVTGPIKDSPYNATPMRPGELMNEPGAMSEWEAEGIARLKKLGDYPVSLPMDDVDLSAEIDFADFDDSSDVGPEARIQMPNSDERRVIDLAMTAGELHRGLPDFDRDSRTYTAGPYSLSWDATTARWTARRSLGDSNGPFVYGYSDDSAFDAMFDAGFKDSDDAIFDGWLKAGNTGVQIDAVSTVFDTPDRPMTDAEAQTAVQQIGGWTIAAISGGRKSIENGRLVMPAGSGYQVRVSLAPDDTYSVERVFVRGTNVYPKGRVDGVYADRLSDVAYRAALYADGPFGEERRQVDAPPSAVSIDLLLGERRKQPKVGQALLEEPGAIGSVPTEVTLEQILDAEQPAISAAFTIDFFDTNDPQMPLTRQFRVLTARQTLDTTDASVFDPMRNGKAQQLNQLSGYAIDDATGDIYRFTHSTLFTAADRERGGTVLTHLVKGEDVDGDGSLEFVDRTNGRPFAPPGAVYATWPGELYGDADFRLYAAAAQTAGVGFTPVGSRRNATIDADASARSFAFLMTSTNVDTVEQLQRELQAFRPNRPSRQFSGADLKAGAVWFNRDRSDVTVDDIETGVPTVEVIVGTNPDRALRHRLTVLAGIQLDDGRFVFSGPPSTLYRTNVKGWERGRAGATWRRQVGRSWGGDDVAIVTGQVIGGAENPEGQIVLDPAPAVSIDALSTEPIAIYEVGGAVRDDLMGIRSDDVDFAVTAPSYEAMKAHLEAQGFRIFQEKEEFVTIKAQPPEGHPLRERTNSADFVLARRDGPSSDGRRPDYTEPGSLEDDLERRDFTVNAIARDETGNLIDPHGGQTDIENRVLRFVGDPDQRVREDGLRVLRGYRFMVTKGLTPEAATWAALTSPESAEMLKSVSKERVAAELQKMFDYDTIGAVQLLGSLPDATLEAIFPEGVRLAPSMKQVKGATKARTIDPLMVDGWLAQRPFVGPNGAPLSWPEVLGRMGGAGAAVEVDPPLRVAGVVNPRDVETSYNNALRFDGEVVDRASEQLRSDRDVSFDGAYRRAAMDQSIDMLRGPDSDPRPYRNPAMINPETGEWALPENWSEVEELEEAGFVVDQEDDRRRNRLWYQHRGIIPWDTDEDEEDDASIDPLMAPSIYGDTDLVRGRQPSLALNALSGSELMGTVAAMSTADLRIALLSGNLLPQQVNAVREELRLREGEAVAASLF
jgi:hypothetical protein